MTLRDLIDEYLKKNKMSYRSFAKTIGISPAYLSMIKNNLNPSTGNPPIVAYETLSKIARGMGMTTHQLFETIEDMPVDIGEPPRSKNVPQKNVPSARAMEVARIYDQLELHTREVIDAIFKIATQNSKPESDVVSALKESEERKLEEFTDQGKAEYKSKIMR